MVVNPEYDSYESGNITSAFPTIDLVRCYRSDNMVEFSIRFSGTSVPYGTPLFTLSEGFRPRNGLFIVASGRLIDSNGVIYSNMLIYADTNGAIKQEVTSDAITSGWLQGIFIA